MMFKFGLTVVFASILLHAAAQNPLPDLSVDSLGKGRTRISWINPYGEGLIQLSVQSSYDSIKDFRTFFSSPSPQLPQNGYVDARPHTGKIYYRVFYAFAGGSYAFSTSKPVGYGPVKQTDEPDATITTTTSNPNNAASRFITVNAHGFAEIKLPDAAEKKYRIIFFDDQNNKLFTLNKVPDIDLVLDKTNFMRAGYYFFEIYNGDKLVERNKIYLPKEF